MIADTLTAKLPLMCNLYSITKGQSAIRDLFRVVHDRIGNVPPLPGIFPVYRYRSCASLAAQCENQDCCNSDFRSKIGEF